MIAAFIESFCADNPENAVVVGERPEPVPVDGWEIVDVMAAAVNHHDVWSARGAGLQLAQLPMILGTDASGRTPAGREVIVHSVVNDPEWDGDETLDPRSALLSEGPQGAMAQRLVVPSINLFDKPPELSFAEASCMPTAWLTAYRMLFTKAALGPGDTVLIQGASGGLSSALIGLAAETGIRVWVTGRTEEKRAYALQGGADDAFEAGARLPERVDAVMDAVGGPTLDHSLRSLRPGGVVVIAGATGGYDAAIDLPRVFRRNLRILGSTMGTRQELRELLDLCVRLDLHPRIEAVIPLQDAPLAVRRLGSGETSGKLVLTP